MAGKSPQNFFVNTSRLLAELKTMMKIKSRTEIKIEKHQIRTVRVNNGSGPIHCQTCGEQTTTLTPEQLASFLRVTVPEICRRIETTEIHLANSERGVGLICGKSLEIEK